MPVALEVSVLAELSWWAISAACSTSWTCSTSGASLTVSVAFGGVMFSRVLGVSFLLSCGVVSGCDSVTVVFLACGGLISFFSVGVGMSSGVVSFSAAGVVSGEICACSWAVAVMEAADSIAVSVKRFFLIFVGVSDKCDDNCLFFEG